MERVLNEPIIPYFVMERGAAMVVLPAGDEGEETDEDAAPLEVFASPARTY